MNSEDLRQFKANAFKGSNNLPEHLVAACYAIAGPEYRPEHTLNWSHENNYYLLTATSNSYIYIHAESETDISNHYKIPETKVRLAECQTIRWAETALKVIDLTAQRVTHHQGDYLEWTVTYALESPATRIVLPSTQNRNELTTAIRNTYLNRP